MNKVLSPTEYSSQLSNDRLSTMARLILDVLDEALQTASTELDCAFTRGTLSWGRIRNAILKEIRMQRHTWLSLKHGGNDLVFGIGDHVIRFFLDDHLNPKKPRVLNPTSGETFQLGLFEVSDYQVNLWRFIVERAANEDDEHRVFFIGYNQSGEIVSKWEYTGPVKILSSVGDRMPAAAQLEPAVLSPIYNDETAEGDDDEAVRSDGKNI